MTALRGRPCRVAYLTTSASVGGAEHQLRHLALVLKQRGCDVRVMSMLPLEPTLSEFGSPGIRTATRALRGGLPTVTDRTVASVAGQLSVGN